MKNFLYAFWLRPRLLIALGLMALVALVAPIDAVALRLLLGWCVGVVAYVALVIVTMHHLAQDVLTQQASDLDDSAPIITLFAVLATIASIGAVGTLIFDQSALNAHKVLGGALVAATMVCSWIFIQINFAVHYLHVFYGGTDMGERRGGLDFSGDDEPDFWDFVYFTITIGATSQTSDTNVCSKRMRRIVTAHGIYSFFFNTSLLAFAVNVATSLTQK